MRGYFFWCGIILNAIIAIGLLAGIGFSIADWIDIYKEEHEDDGCRKSRKGTEFKGADSVADGTTGSHLKQP